ncbi:MAG: hypothetical protein Unbinned8261contig1001_53 [Prokaryotic dsDNA virus sp.]|nr:MAG: hypothetical protein Unbinned8261contig1001_53 [Prokaryotic dsDNA virus sp.]|tara:strand:+ start:3686 stop:4054 length:369 start_codon:yes stop_codon:yes gene_type:complete
MASAYHLLLCEDVTVPTGASTYTAQDIKVLASTSTEYILVCTIAGAAGSIRLEHSADKTNWTEVKDVDKAVIQVEATDTANTAFMVWVDTPLLQYVRAKVGNATSVTGTITCTVRLQYNTKK